MNISHLTFTKVAADVYSNIYSNITYWNNQVHGLEPPRLYTLVLNAVCNEVGVKIESKAREELNKNLRSRVK